jgi:hypothetical protein
MVRLTIGEELPRTRRIAGPLPLWSTVLCAITQGKEPPTFATSVFRMTPAGAPTTLHNFCSQPNCTDGKPQKVLWWWLASDGGTVFSLGVGLRPFVETDPSSGEAGAQIKILGTHLTGATRVSFNGETKNGNSLEDAVAVAATLIR